MCMYPIHGGVLALSLDPLSAICMTPLPWAVYALSLDSLPAMGMPSFLR